MRTSTATAQLTQLVGAGGHHHEKAASRRVTPAVSEANTQEA